MSVHKLRQLLVADESTFLENFATPASISWSKNIPVIGDITFEMPHERIMDGAAQ